MADKVEVTLVFYEKDDEGNVLEKEFPARLNAVAPLEMLLPALIKAYERDVKLAPPEQLKVFLELPRPLSLSKVQIVNGSRIIIMSDMGALVEPLPKNPSDSK